MNVEPALRKEMLANFILKVIGRGAGLTFLKRSRSSPCNVPVKQDTLRQLIIKTVEGVEGTDKSYKLFHKKKKVQLPKNLQVKI